MKFSAIVFSVGLIGYASARTVEGSYPASVTDCLDKCNEEDVNCRAQCLGNPYPNMADVTATNKCSAACNQGDGTAKATEAYGNCLDDCRKSFYMPGSSPSYGAANVTVAANEPIATATATAATPTGSATASTLSSTNSTSSSGTNSTDSSGSSSSDSSSSSTESSPSRSTTSTAAEPTTTASAAGKLIASGAGFVAIAVGFFVM